MAELPRPFEFDPHRGVLPLRFGMSRDEAYEALQSRPYAIDPDFLREKVTRELFQLTPALAVTFDANGTIESIEVIGSVGLIWDGIDLLRLDARALRSQLEARKLCIQEDGSSYRCDGIGLAVDAPGLAEGRRRPKIRSLMAYPPGYYGASESVHEERSTTAIDLEFIPGEGVGPIRFAMSVSAVRAALRAEPDDSEVDEATGYTLEYYESDPELIVSFSADGVDAITVEGTSGLTWDGLDLFDAPADVLRETLVARKLRTEPTPSGYRCDDIGLAITSLELVRGEPRPPVSACTIYRPGGWDSVCVPTKD